MVGKRSTGKRERKKHAIKSKLQTATLEDSFIVSYKANHSLAIQSSNHTPRYLPKLAEVFVHTKTCT